MRNQTSYKLFITFTLFVSLICTSICLAKDRETATVNPVHKSLFAPLPKITPPKTESEKTKIALGEKLYLDPILSLEKDISCNSCHLLDKFGVDNEPTSPGHKGQRGDRNSPSSYNASFHIAQFWDGRAADLEEQALGPVLNPVEMAMPSEEEVIKRLSNHKEYPSLFKKAFPDEKTPLTYKNMGNAIGAFERTLLTPGRFDEYLEGKADALTPEERAGLDTFVETGCNACHLGAGLGGSMYQKLGLVKPYETEDLGRYNHTKQDADKYYFKVPSLRNIEKTAPYFHDGSVKTLEEAVGLMAKHQLGKELTKEQTQSIVTFLNSLTGELPKKYQNNHS